MMDVCKKIVDMVLTISAAESCTAGMFASRLGDYPGISASLKESYVTYSNEAKMKLLGVKKDTIDKFTEVSAECALEMANGLYEATKSDICISVTGYAGPTGENVGLVFIGLRYQGETIVKELNIENKGRAYIRETATNEMFEMLKKVL